MDFLELALKRTSVRGYKDKPVEDQKLMKILEAGRISPSAANFQPWHFIVIREREQRHRICKTFRRDWMQEAPVIIAVCGDHNEAWKREDGKDHLDLDIAIAVDHMSLAAAELGLGTCWVCNFNAARCKEILELPEGIDPIVLLPLGYAESIHASDYHFDRKKMEEILHFEKFTSRTT